VTRVARAVFVAALVALVLGVAVSAVWACGGPGKGILAITVFTSGPFGGMRPYAGAAITVTDQTGAIAAKLRTDSHGACGTELRPGRSSVRCVFPTIFGGYRPYVQTESARLSGAHPTSLTFVAQLK